jgi:hypothetical protein
MATIVPDTSTPKSANSSQLIERLGVVMSTFDDKTTKLLTFQQEAFNKSIKLLQDGATFATVGSSQRFRILTMCCRNDDCRIVGLTKKFHYGPPMLVGSSLTPSRVESCRK